MYGQKTIRIYLSNRWQVAGVISMASYIHLLLKQIMMQSRRLFLKTLGLSIGATALAGYGLADIPGEHAWESEQTSKAHGDKVLGIALVGLGKYSTGQLAPALQQTKRCRLAGIVTGTPSKAKEWSSKYKIPEKNIYNYDTFDTIADNPDIDIVYVVLPNSMHAEYTIRAAKAGKHVICEKPMATTVEDCEKMISACKEAGKELFIGYRLHYEPYNMEMMRLGQEKAFGAVSKIVAENGFPVGDPNQWRLKKAMAGGGSLMDVGIYCLQGARYTLGAEPLSVMAQIESSKDPKFKEVEDIIYWQMEFPGGAKAECTSSYSKSMNKLHADAAKGWFELSPAYQYSGLSGKTSLGKMNLPQVNQQAVQMDAMAETIINKTKNRAPGEEGLQDLKIIKAIYRAAESGRKVML